MMGLESDEASVHSIVLFVVLLCICTLIGHLLEKNRWINSTTIGFGTGAVILYVSKGLFKNLDVGFLETGDYIAIGAIFAATDSVCTLQILSQEDTPLLYSLVFGESVVNDATSVVLFNVIQKFQLSAGGSSVALEFVGNFLYLFIASTLLGVIIGLCCSYATKKLYFGRHSTDREIAVMLLMAYLSYMMAELFGLSGILSVFFCGIVMSHYSWHNVTENSRITTKHGFATMSFIAETFIFLYVGMDALDVEKWKFVAHSLGTSVGVCSILLALVLVGRAASVFPLSFLLNLTKQATSEQVEFNQQVIIWWAGLMRGSVSVALAYNQFAKSGHTQQRGNAIMITSTITLVFFSTLVYGMMTKPLLWLLVSPSKYSSNVVHSESSDPSSPKSLSLPLLCNMQDSEPDMANDIISGPSSIRMLLTTPTRTVHFYWRKFDDMYMRPMFGGWRLSDAPGSITGGSIIS